MHLVLINERWKKCLDGIQCCLQSSLRHYEVKNIKIIHLIIRYYKKVYIQNKAENNASSLLENFFRNQNLEKVCYFHLYGVSLEASSILAIAASIPSSSRANQFFCCNVRSNFWWYFWLLCIPSQWEPQRKHIWTPCQWQINCLKLISAGV